MQPHQDPPTAVRAGTAFSRCPGFVDSPAFEAGGLVALGLDGGVDLVEEVVHGHLALGLGLHAQPSSFQS